MNTETLYDAWSADRRSSNPQPLKSWIARYPNFRDDLTRWTAEAPVVEAAEGIPGDPQGEARILEIGLRVVAEMRARYETTAPAPLASLLETMKAQGYTVKSFAKRLDVGPTTVAKLHDRLFRAASVPQELVNRVAESLHVTAEQVRAYLQQPATLAAGARYKSSDVPQIADQQDFAQAVRECSDMTEDEKAFWLSVE